MDSFRRYAPRYYTVKPIFAPIVAQSNVFHARFASRSRQKIVMRAFWDDDVVVHRILRTSRERKNRSFDGVRLSGRDNNAADRRRLRSDRRRLRTIRANRRPTGSRTVGPARRHRGETPPHRRKRLLRDRRRHRHRSAPLRRTPLPHLKPTRMGIRQPIHRIYRLPAPSLDHSRRSRLPHARQPPDHQPILRLLLLPRRSPRPHRQPSSRNPARSRLR